MASGEARFAEVEIVNGATIQLCNAFDRIGRGSRVGPLTELSSASGGSIVIGERCEIGRGALILTYGGNIEIGSDCSINPYCVIYGHGGVKIGNFVRIATHTVIIPANHRYDRRDVPIHQQGLTQKGIIIEDDVWIGARVVVLDGVRIGKGSIIGAGSVVTSDVEMFTISAGVPARALRSRF